MSLTLRALWSLGPFTATAKIFNFADLPCPSPVLCLETRKLHHTQFVPPRAFLSSLGAVNPAAGQGSAEWIRAGDAPLALVTTGPPDRPEQSIGASLRLEGMCLEMHTW